VIEAAFSNTGFFYDLIDAGRIISLLVKEPGCGIKYFLLCRDGFLIHATNIKNIK
jgi:hypothetical protein